DQPTPLELTASAVAKGTAGLGSAILHVPEFGARMGDGFADAADRIGQAIGLPDWMMERKYIAPHDVLKPIARGIEVGAVKLGGANEVGQAIESFGEFFQSEASLERMR